jgi:NAD(P)-dependent dehydrogenase (short-subunit alcohol dehydrogenase family)
MSSSSPTDVPTAFDGVGALVTGGAGGLGEATVRRLHALGSHVVIADNDEQRAEALASELGDRVAAVRTDVTQTDDLAAAISAAERAPRGFRILVACAGIGFEGVMVDDDGNPHPLDTFEQHIRVNLIGVFDTVRLSAASMSKNEPAADDERGVMVLTGSVNAYEGAAGETQYSASKGGVHAITLPAARDLGPRGIRVNTIAPGPFATGMLAEQTAELQDKYAGTITFPKRFGYPDEFASMAVELVVNRMFNGSIIRIDGAGRYG